LKPFVSAIYDATQKVFWSLANCWILFTITSNSEEEKQSFIERFLSHKFFKFVGRLTLVAYLMHPIVQSLLLSTQQQHLYSSTILMVSSNQNFRYNLTEFFSNQNFWYNLTEFLSNLVSILYKLMNKFRFFHYRPI
jgi:hypothetical protein